MTSKKSRQKFTGLKLCWIHTFSILMYTNLILSYLLQLFFCNVCHISTALVLCVIAALMRGRPHFEHFIPTSVLLYCFTGFRPSVSPLAFSASILFTMACSWTWTCLLNMELSLLNLMKDQPQHYHTLPLIQVLMEAAESSLCAPVILVQYFPGEYGVLQVALQVVE